MPKVSLTADSAAILIDWHAEGSGDYVVSIEAEADGFRGHADGHAVGAAVREFVRGLIRLEQSRKGKAQLASVIQNEFQVTIQAIDGVGHMGVSGILRAGPFGPEGRPPQMLKFFFEFDPSQLPEAVRQAQLV